MVKNQLFPVMGIELASYNANSSLQTSFHPGDTTLLLGLYSTILETGNRIELPKDYAEQFEDGLFITQGFDRNIMALTMDAFEEIYERVTSVNIADPLARLLLRMILSSAYRAEVGPDGTIQMSESLKKMARLEKDVVVVGQGDFIEIWSADTWEQQTEQLLAMETDPGRFASLLITTR
jgi:MraZ protein